MTSFGWENRAEFYDHVTRRMGMRGMTLHRERTGNVMRGKPHFVESSDPIPSGNDYRSICGEEIKDAFFAFEWDVEFMGKIILREEKICHKCLKAVASRIEPGKKYLYGALPGTEVVKRPDFEE